MKKKMICTGLLAATAMLAALPAAAQDTRMVVPIYKIAGSCKFSSTIGGKTELVVPEGTNELETVLPYECNFKGLPTVTISSLYGGLEPQSDAVNNGAPNKPIAYNIAFGDGVTSAQGAMTSAEFLNGVSSTTVAGGWTTALGAGNAVKPTLALYFPTLPTTKGTYLDALTISIAP